MATKRKNENEFCSLEPMHSVMRQSCSKADFASPIILQITPL